MSHPYKSPKEEGNDNFMNEYDFSEYTYVMCSTLNQMVNYIPLYIKANKKFKNLILITTTDKKNEVWDHNLKKMADISNLNEIKITLENIILTNITDIATFIREELKKYPIDKIFWNITGGQRPILLAIHQIIQNSDFERHLSCYLEGNSHQLVIIDHKENINIIIEYEIPDIETLDINKALGLAGFDISNFKLHKDNFLTNYDKNDEIIFRGLLDIYEKNLTVRDILIETKSNKQSAIDKIENLDSISNDIKKKLLYIMNNENEPFGYILERLVAYKVREVVQDYALDMALNMRIEFKDDPANLNWIDEIDIALLTKQGKFIVFECKSGHMTGDNAKSHKYSTYAISGVYGKPILVTPLLQNEIACDDNSKLSDTWKKLSDDYTNIKKSIGAAKRANLEVWGIDEIEDRLQKLLKI